MKVFRIIIIIAILIFSVDGKGQTSTMPVINKIVNSFLDTLLKDKELDSKDTLLLGNQFEIDKRFLSISNFKLITDSLKGDYYILRYSFEELKDNSIKVRVQLNTIKLYRFGSEETSGTHIYENYWILYDCEKKDWMIKK